MLLQVLMHCKNESYFKGNYSYSVCYNIMETNGYPAVVHYKPFDPLVL